MQTRLLQIALLLSMFLSTPLLASTGTPYIAPSMKQWVDWVTFGNEKYACPSIYNDKDSHLCLWPSTLYLTVNENTGGFSQEWHVLSGGRIPLPGGDENWPSDVRLNGRPAPVTPDAYGNPSINASNGQHTVTGKFRWRSLPQKLRVPDITGIIRLKMQDRTIHEPFIDSENRVWIAEPSGKKASSAPLSETAMTDVRISRLIDDGIPLEVYTNIHLTVSGEKRREKLGNCLVKNSEAVSVSSPLPLKLSENGEIWFEAAPGEWDIVVRSIISSPESELSIPAHAYGDEIWSFRPQPDLRISLVEGVHAVDPNQTTIPEKWKQYSAWLVKKDSVFRIREIKRGRSETAADDLSLKRDIWLDFDGKGATVKDHIKGRLARRFFMGIDASHYTPGRITFNGRDQLVTSLSETDKSDGEKRINGIELERGSVDILAVSRIESAGSGDPILTGWNTNFKTAGAVINIPPGWHLFSINGGESHKGATWISRWSLLDLFIVLIISFAVARIWPWWWGIVFFAGLALVFQENGAPRYVWLVLIVTSALIKYMTKAGTAGTDFKFRWVRILHVSALLLLAAGGTFFIYTQMRMAIYPQLENRHSINRYDTQEVVLSTSSIDSRMKTARSGAPAFFREQNTYDAAVPDSYYVKPDETAATQTGPGIPAWKWKSVSVDFGSVSGMHELVLYIISPFQNSVLSIFRVCFILVLAFRFLFIKIPGKPGKGKWAGIAFIAILLAAMASPGQASADSFPSDELLEQLRERVMKPADCFPHCAEISGITITLDKKSQTPPDKTFIRLDLDVHAAIKTAVPVPDGDRSWSYAGIFLDGSPYDITLRKNGWKYMLVPEGVHKITVRGITKAPDSFRVRFPLKPRYADIHIPGWDVSGIDDSHISSLLKFKKKETDSSRSEPSAQTDFFSDNRSRLSGFLRVRRTLVLGLEWEAVTSVERFVMSESSQSITAAIPLIKGEKVRSEGIKVKDGHARIEMAPETNKIQWRSSLPLTPAITLHADENANWTEIWSLNAAPRWHYTSSGLPVTYPDKTPGTFWYPWPGETLDISVTRLDTVPGDVLTIESAEARFYPGNTYSRLTLDTRIRTSRGKSHPITAPEGSVLKRLKIDGRVHPVSGKNNTVLLPLQPGDRKVEAEWELPPLEKKSRITGLFIPWKIRFPEIRMNHKSTNIDTYIHMPEKLWLLFASGPRTGPAVTAWGYMAVILTAAVLLGRYAPSPLKTWQWLLLGTGLATLDPMTIVLVCAWFIAVETREKYMPESPLGFNVIQIALSAWGIFTLLAIYEAVKTGLLGIPEMQVAGNGSTQSVLHWTMDRCADSLPQPGALVVSLNMWHLVMFVWALWITSSIISWTKWAAAAMRKNGGWKKNRFFVKKDKEKTRGKTVEKTNPPE